MRNGAETVSGGREHTMVRKRLAAHRGQLLGMTVGSGLYYKYAKMNQADMVLALSASRFRQMGINSLAGSLPFDSANRMVYDFACREILPQNPKIPVVFGLCAVDPTIELESYIEMLKNDGFAGICNLPTVGIMDGRFGWELEQAGFSFQKEISAIAIAHRKGMFTVGLVRDEKQAEEMLLAGCDVICVHFGAAKGGVLGTRQELSLREAATMAEQIFQLCQTRAPSAFRMFYGGPAKTPSSIRYLLEHTNADGFIGGYTFERYLLEKSMQNNVIKDTFFNHSEAAGEGGKNQRVDYVEYLKQCIEKRYMEPLSLKQLAEELHVSRPYLSSLAARELGEPFSDYLIGYRMYKASSLLLNTTMSAESIGAQVGYPNYAHFSKLFKKKIGISPFHYRKQYSQRT